MFLEDSGELADSVHWMRNRKYRQTQDELSYWLKHVADYVKRKRGETKKGQKELPVVRQTLSAIENASLNFTIGNLLEVLHAVNGDILEAFGTKVPDSVPSQFKGTVAQLLDLLEMGGKPADWIAGNIETFHEHYIRSRRTPPAR